MLARFTNLACCRGAAQGEGLGNAFLSNITAVDGIFHVLRTFEDADITHVEDRVDPVDDMKIIHAELRAKDLERVGKIIDVRRCQDAIVPCCLSAAATSRTQQKLSRTGTLQQAHVVVHALAPFRRSLQAC